MRICIDASPAVHRRAGIGRYTQELLAALLAIVPDNEYVTFYNRPSEAHIASPLDRLPRLTTYLADKPWRTSVLLAHLARIPQDCLLPGVDLFHATDHLLPHFSQIKSIFTLHDLTFRLYPQTHSSWNRWFLTLMMPYFLQAADAVIADSECTKRDAVRLYEINEAKIQVIYPGVSGHFHPASSKAITDIRQKYALPEHFILSVSSIEPRKNLNALLEAFHHLLATCDLHLVLVGKKGWLYESFFRRLQELGLENQVLFTGYVPDEDLPAIYSAASVFVFPSLYEGFGLPVLEAMACGVPVVCSDTSSLPEVVGDAGIMVAPHNIRALVQAIEWVLTNESKCQEMRTKGLQQASKFTWEKTAREALTLYRQVLGT